MNEDKIIACKNRLAIYDKMYEATFEALMKAKYNSDNHKKLVAMERTLERRYNCNMTRLRNLTKASV